MHSRGRWVGGEDGVILANREVLEGGLDRLSRRQTVAQGIDD
jgi:hypothetical protein